MACMAWPNSWKSVTTSSCDRSEGRSACGAGKLQISATRGPLVFAVVQQFAVDDAELGEVVVFALAREHVQVETGPSARRWRHRTRRKAGGRPPICRAASTRLEFQAENPLVDGEHPFQAALVGEINFQGVLIDGVFLLLELVGVIAPVPEVDLRVGIAGFLDLQRAKFGDFGVELGLQAGLQPLQKVRRRCAAVLAILTSMA